MIAYVTVGPTTWVSLNNFIPLSFQALAMD
ncbi:hypothetical protein GGR95_002717 [Sulfitobacter undariae]|uniref:Uncharacterized protein n=1 Tax=Sulfitobacter undariae TaxID=1563671 RepID=A0A7W6E9H2_9RHOB|nr:hypothetical protein [Sulfitobacter undariae]